MDIILKLKCVIWMRDTYSFATCRGLYMHHIIWNLTYDSISYIYTLYKTVNIYYKQAEIHFTEMYSLFAKNVINLCSPP